jgi:CelD/BcsL family acetyltransferase involved in cellulose biosynthesis
MPLTVQTGDFEGIEQEWESLLPHCVTDNIFLTPSWQKLWWNRFADGADLMLTCVREDDVLVGIAPLTMRDGVVSFLGDTDLVDYHDMLVRRGSEDVFYEALCDFLFGLDWHTLDLRSLPEDSPSLARMSKLAESKGLTVDIEREDMAPVAVLPSTWDEYLSGLRKKDRHELRRKLRRLEGTDSPRQYTCQTPETVESCMKDFFRLLRASREDKDEFMTPAREEFFLDVARELSGKGQFRLYFLEIEGVRVASCICFDYADAFLLYNSGYDPEYSALSVGLLNKALCVKEAIEMRRASFDFLRGTERYKYNLGAKDKAVYKMVVRR